MRFGLLFALLCSLALVGCDNPLDLEGPSLDFETEHFDGTLNPGERQTRNFTVKEDGQVIVTLQSAGSAATIRFGYGVPEAGGCTPVKFTTFNLSVAVPRYADPIFAGQYCAIIEDDGTLTGPIEFRILIEHT